MISNKINGQKWAHANWSSFGSSAAYFRTFENSTWNFRPYFFSVFCFSTIILYHPANWLNRNWSWNRFIEGFYNDIYSRLKAKIKRSLQKSFDKVCLISLYCAHFGLLCHLTFWTFGHYFLWPFEHIWLYVWISKICSKIRSNR